MGFHVIEQIRKHKYLSVAFLILVIFFWAWLIWKDAERRYDALLSTVVFDRNNLPISIAENSKGHYVSEVAELPEDFEELLIKKEDRFFSYHPGINPVSTIRAIINYITEGRAGGSSTLTQQLAKNLLGTEVERSFTNKITESFYALSIELFTTKKEIIRMYANSVYLGHQVQGFNTASYAYFDKPLSKASHSEQIALLATLSHPSTRNPWEEEGVNFATSLNEWISPEKEYIQPLVTEEYSFQSDSAFELNTAGIVCDNNCTTTIDDELTRRIRMILDRHVNNGQARNIRNGAVVVIDSRTGELLAMIGSRDPKRKTSGNQINMAIEPRPIGSTIKPFIYVKGFELGLRPYTLVEDREYKYPIATGFSLYPKNYDGLYRGTVNLHESLSNSLNVPSVKVLEYIGLDNFYSFLDESLSFSPIQDYDSYQYGIALGGLEMDLLTLTHYFTLFPGQGELLPLRVIKDNAQNFDLPPQSSIKNPRHVVDKKYIELVHTIISDRFTGVNQFGLEGNLNLTYPEYGVKTGTSRDFHDSWVVGYTTDFTVGVWLGNSENQALAQVSGATGAGAVWHDVMEYLLNTNYHTATPFSYNHTERFLINNNEEWGLKNDTPEQHLNLLLQDNLILSLHNDDQFELVPDLTIPLKARRTVEWTINGESHGFEKETSFKPSESGEFEVMAYDKENNQREIVVIDIISPERLQ